MRIPDHRVWCKLAWLALALSMPPAACQAQATSAAPPDSRAASGGSGSAPPALLAECQQLAHILGVDQDCANLAALAQAREQAASPETSLEILGYRERITEAVVLASLDADTALEQIGAEQNQVAELRSLLRARRDRAPGNGAAAGSIRHAARTGAGSRIAGFPGDRKRRCRYRWGLRRGIAPGGALPGVFCC